MGRYSSAIIRTPIETEEILLQLRDDKVGIRFPGVYSLFGGALENSETPEEGLRRELEEELGITLQNSCRLLRTYFWEEDYERVVKGIRRKLPNVDYYWGFDPARVDRAQFPREDNLFLLTMTKAGIEGLVINEGREMKLFSPDAAKAAIMIPADKLMVLEYIINRIQ